MSKIYSVRKIEPGNVYNECIRNLKMLKEYLFWNKVVNETIMLKKILKIHLILKNGKTGAKIYLIISNKLEFIFIIFSKKNFALF